MELCKTKAQTGFSNLKIGGYLAYTPWGTPVGSCRGRRRRACFLFSQNVGRPANNPLSAVRVS